MRILMVTASLPYPPHQGGAIRAYGILHGLHQAGHHVTLLSFHDPSQPIDIGKTPLARYCERVITVPLPTRSTSTRLRDLLLTSHADIARRLESDTMHKQLSELVQTQAFDLVQFEGLEITGYLFTVKRIKPELPVIYDSFNAEAALQKIIAQVDRGDLRRLPSAVYSYMQVSRIEQFERAICEAAAAVIAVSEEDAAELREFRRDGQVFVVPSGIFVDDYANSTSQLDLKANALVFTGKMDYRPNVDAMMWFASEVLPQIPEANLYIVGQKPHKRLDTLRGTPNIQITGWVEEVQPYLNSADVYVAPLRMGSGTRLKILEAMASGCAMVATSTATAGLTQEAHNHMMITDDSAQMAAEISNLLQQPEKRVKLGASARDFIRDNYDWSVIIPRLLHAYKEIGLE